MATVTLSTSIQPRTPQGEFRNEAFLDFKSHENARAMREALKHVAGQLGHEYDLIIGGERLKTEGKIRSLNYLATGLATDRVPEDDVILVAVHFTKDNGELSSITLDDRCAAIGAPVV